MKNYLEHPADEVLERFLLHGSDEEEVEVVETHVMACESCVTRLETLETEIAATKLALQNVRLDEAARSTAPQTANWRSWFSMPKLSLAGACAAVALGVLITPEFLSHSAPVAQVSLVAYRGLETPVLPKDRPLHINLNASELASNAVDVELVNADGIRNWRGTAAIQENLVSVNVPRIKQAGQYFFRLYSPSSNGESELLREFAVQVK